MFSQDMLIDGTISTKKTSIQLELGDPMIVETQNTTQIHKNFQDLGFNTSDANQETVKIPESVEYNETIEKQLMNTMDISTSEEVKYEENIVILHKLQKLLLWRWICHQSAHAQLGCNIH
jgi:hypothetical protein